MLLEYLHFFMQKQFRPAKIFFSKLNFKKKILNDKNLFLKFLKKKNLSKINS